jgi:hypothetical protein
MESMTDTGDGGSGARRIIKSKKFRLYFSIALLVIVLAWLTSQILANQSKSEYARTFNDLKSLGVEAICDSGNADLGFGGKSSYDVFMHTRANPESRLVEQALKRGYGVASDLDLVNKLSKSANHNGDVPYSDANFYLTGSRQDFHLKIRIFQAGNARLQCGDQSGQLVPVSMAKPVVEIKVER